MPYFYPFHPSSSNLVAVTFSTPTHTVTARREHTNPRSLKVSAKADVHSNMSTATNEANSTRPATTAKTTPRPEVNRARA